MSNAVSLTGQDAITINGRILADLADGEVASLTFPNKLATVKTGKDGNALFGFNASGQQAELTLRLMRGGSDDKFLNGLLANQQLNFAGFTLLAGTMVKKVGDGAGNIKNDTYIVAGGVFDEQVSVKSNVEGDTEQSVSIYKIHFATVSRVIS